MQIYYFFNFGLMNIEKLDKNSIFMQF